MTSLIKTVHDQPVRVKLALILLLNLILTLPSLWVPFYKVDELTNAIYGRFLLSGELTLRDMVGNATFLMYYLYAFLLKFVDGNSLMIVHAFHIVWRSVTVLAFYWAGKALRDEKTGIWSALFYCVGTWSFLSKDFHTPSAESLALLPGALCAGFMFRGIDREKAWAFAVAALFAAVATLFKSSLGIMIAVICLTLAVRGKNFVRNTLAACAVFAFCLIVPALLVWPPTEGLRIMLDQLRFINSAYIQTYSEMNFLYWFAKFSLRTAMILACCLGLSAFACHSFRDLFLAREKDRKLWEKLFYLALLVLAFLYVVTIGKRVFYYYYTNLFAPLSLLAGVGLANFDRAFLITDRDRRKGMFRFLRSLRKAIIPVVLVPALFFGVEGALNFSTRQVIPQVFTDATDYVARHTKAGERIFVWGYVPQLYFFSGRQPATTFIWSDFLAGTSPGSPAMEYVRATGISLNLGEKLIKDLVPNTFTSKEVNRVGRDGLNAINDNELFTVEELLQRISEPNWRQVFNDFFRHPPELFIDTSPTNYRGFANFPIENYELLKRFLIENYTLETLVHNIPIYRLTDASKQAGIAGKVSD